MPRRLGDRPHVGGCGWGGCDCLPLRAAENHDIWLRGYLVRSRRFSRIVLAKNEAEARELYRARFPRARIQRVTREAPGGRIGQESSGSYTVRLTPRNLELERDIVARTYRQD